MMSAARVLLTGWMAGAVCAAQAAPALPVHLAGSWGTSESLFSGHDAQAQLHLAPDGLGLMAGSSSAPVRLEGAAASSGPMPRAIIGFPVQAELDSGGLKLQVLMPQKPQLQAASGVVFVCRYDVEAPSLTCTGTAREVLKLSRLSEQLTSEVEKQLEQIRTRMPR